MSTREAYAAEFARNLRMARRRADLSQTELARRAGLSTDTVHKVENEKRTPGLVTIHLLARTLEVTPGELIEGLRR